MGSDVQGGIADVVGLGRDPTDRVSVDDARERVRENPRDAQALRDLATALTTEGRPEEAIEPLQRYTQLRPRDLGALRELAGLHMRRANRIRQQAQEAQLEAQLANPGTDFLPPASTPLGQALAKRPVNDALATAANERLTSLITQLQRAYNDAKGVYQRLAVADPNDPSIQIFLADTAQNAGDTQTALAAYRRFLRLAPDDPLVPQVREQIARLEQQAQGRAGG